jgi:hypothetical protein
MTKWYPLQFESWIYILKVRFLMEFLGEFFYGVWYYTSIKSKQSKNLKLLDEILFKKKKKSFF